MTKSFEAFDVYKKAVILTKSIFKILENENFNQEYGFKNQLKRAVLSITNNIAEGSEYNNNKQFVRFLKIAKGSTAEVRNMLTLSHELGFLLKDEVQESIEASVEISKNISNFIKYLESNIEKQNI